MHPGGILRMPQAADVVVNQEELEGRFALVTGSSDGIGLAIARELRLAGATVVINGRDPARLADAKELLEKDEVEGSPSVLALAADIERPRQAQALVERAIHECGQL